MTTSDVRTAHKLLDRVSQGRAVLEEEISLLRSFLPELPAQKTLEEIAWDIHFAWCETSGNDWKEELFGDLETWLSELHSQLRAHLEGVKSEAHPEFLETEGAYYAAPSGTVVATSGRLPWVKEGDRNWSCIGGTKSDNGMAKNGKLKVLRWGWGG